MNLLTILFLSTTTISGTVVLGVGLANIPQPSTTYIEGSGETAQSIARKNNDIILNSLAFKEAMIGTGLIILSVILLVGAKYRDERISILAEEQEEKIRQKTNVKTPVNKLLIKSAEPNALTNVVISERAPTQLNLLQVQRQNYPRSILKNSSLQNLNTVNKQIVPQYPRPFTKLYPGYNRQIIPVV
jgi:hypothetical protein